MSATDNVLFALRQYFHRDADPNARAVNLLAQHDADTHDAEDYPGELDMLRGLVATLRAVTAHGDLADVRQLLEEHKRDDADARAAGEKSSRPAADATPDRDSTRERRLAQLLDTIRTHGGKWSTGTLQQLRRQTGGPVQRGTARRDLAELHRRGHLHQHGAGDGRFYTLRHRTGGA
ncbi:hypothetical protein ACIGCZ_00870 [Streptomyces nigra]|uniref:hypothetical protein n=1 Tax=Streptomyces nigra TaxID=1827580 RepID=UPI0037CEF839